MKLPKPGKVKLPKTGNKKLPSFRLKNGFIKKNLITLIAIAVLLVGSGTAYGTLASREADRGFDPVDGVNEDRYQVLVSGEGYKLNKQQEKNYKLQKKQNEVNAERTAMNAQNPTNIRTSSGTRYYRSSNYRYRYRGSSYKVTRTPQLKTNIQSQIRSKMNWKAGDELEFRLAAYAYPYGSKNAISKDNIKVTSDGGTLKHNGEKYGYQWYTLTLAEGTNKVTITVKDKKTKKKYKSSPYTVTAGKNSGSSTKPTDPTNPENPTTEEAAVSVGFGLTSDKITITDKTTAADVLSHTPGVLMENGNVVSVTGDMSGISLKKLEGYNKDAFKEICIREKGSDIEEDKNSHEDEIKEKLRKEFSDKPVEEMTEEEIEKLNEYIAENFDKYYMDHFFDDFYDEWIGDLDAEIHEKTTITNGDVFHDDFKFKWKYNNVKGKKVLKEINLRLTLEKV